MDALLMLDQAMRGDARTGHEGILWEEADRRLLR